MTIAQKGSLCLQTVLGVSVLHTPMEVHQKIMACLKEGSQFNTLPIFTPPSVQIIISAKFYRILLRFDRGEVNTLQAIIGAYIPGDLSFIAITEHV
ncbi:MAG: hypothetical protein UZ08_BCD001001184 [Candidatus Parvibacillus calidus]|nr:MAG: hypothetical protein UZ08_BCD001001184 [Candidatus Parvibacillus calidus]